VLTETGGKPVPVTELEITTSMKELASQEGLLLAPEGAALLAALKKLLADNSIGRSERILLLNTGSGYKYLENLG
jgi:threonine synthase